MRLCLIASSMTVPSRDWHYPQVPPLVIAYLAATARRAGHTVTVVDALGEALDDYHEFIHDSFVNGLSIEGVVKRVNRDAQVIGIGVMFSKNWPLVRRLVFALREAFPSAVLVVGGVTRRRRSEMIEKNVVSDVQ